MRITSTRTIAAPAAAVWQVLGRQFADVSVWASEVPASAPVHGARENAPGGPTAGAPCDGRVCTVATPGFDEVREDLLAYDDDARSLTYRAAAGMPGFVTEARNTWAVRDLGGGRSEARMTAEVQVRPGARVALPALAVLLRRLGRHTLADLDHYVVSGRPSPRKGRRGAASGAGPGRGVLRANAAFSVVSGAVLAAGAPTWAPAFGDVDPRVLVAVGAGVVGFGAVVAVVGRAPGRRALAVLGVLDGVWVAGSAALLAAAGRHLTAGAWAAVLGVAAVVGVLGVLEVRAAGRSGWDAGRRPPGRPRPA